MNFVKRKLLVELLVIFVMIAYTHQTASFIEAADLGPWQETAPLPYELASHTAYAKKETIFVVGGASAFGVPTYLSANGSLSGEIAKWNTLTPPVALFWHVSTSKDNFLYLLGGVNFPPAEYFDTVSLGVMDTSGKIDQFIAVNPLPEKLALGAAIVANNTLYYAGGFNPDHVSQKIYSSQLRADGTLGPWIASGELPEALSGLGMIYHNNSLIIVGGSNPTHGSSKRVYKATIKPDGTIALWEELMPLPEPSDRSSITKIGSELYVIGGTSIADKVYHAHINSDATIGDWILSTNRLPQPTWGAAIATTTKYLYLIGGFNGNYLQTVVYTKIDSPELVVPYFSQNDPTWANDEYDHTKLLKAEKTTMDTWGCAVTSAAMVLHTHGMHIMPDGNELNPGTVNAWLKANNGYSYGYGKDGWYSWINFPSITKLAMDLYKQGKSPVKLMYERHFPNDQTTQMLDTDLQYGNDFGPFPDILHVTSLKGSTQPIGHFIVATAKKDDTYAINDPEWNYTTLTNFNNHYDQVDRYIPSHTNLSYIDIITPPEVEILLTDSTQKRSGSIYLNGKQTFNEIATANYSLQSPLITYTASDKTISLGTGVHELLYALPPSGQYTITFSTTSDSNYQANILLYAADGTTSQTIIPGILRKNQIETVTLNYSQESVSKVSKNITFQTTIADIKSLAVTKLLLNKAAESSLTSLIQQAEKNYLAKRNMVEKQLFKAFERVLSALDPQLITPKAIELLFYDVHYLEKYY